MAYSIIELQTDKDGNTAATPIQTRKDENEARSVFHQVAAAASISKVPIHTVFFVDELGVRKDIEVVVHDQAETPE